MFSMCRCWASIVSVVCLNTRFGWHLASLFNAFIVSLYKSIKDKVFFIHIFSNQSYEWVPRSSVWESYSQGVEIMWQDSLVIGCLEVFLVRRFFGWGLWLVKYWLAQGLLPHSIWVIDGRVMCHTPYDMGMSLLDLWVVVGEQPAKCDSDDWPHAMVDNGQVIKLRWCVNPWTWTNKILLCIDV